MTAVASLPVLAREVRERRGRKGVTGKGGGGNGGRAPTWIYAFLDIHSINFWQHTRQHWAQASRYWTILFWDFFICFCTRQSQRRRRTAPEPQPRDERVVVDRGAPPLPPISPRGAGLDEEDNHAKGGYDSDEEAAHGDATRVVLDHPHEASRQWQPVRVL